MYYLYQNHKIKKEGLCACFLGGGRKRFAPIVLTTCTDSFQFLSENWGKFKNGVYVGGERDKAFRTQLCGAKGYGFFGRFGVK